MEHRALGTLLISSQSGGRRSGEVVGTRGALDYLPAAAAPLHDARLDGCSELAGLMAMWSHRR